MLSKRIKKLLLAIAVSFICLLPISFKAIPAANNNTQIILDLAHLDSGIDDGAAYGGYTERELVNNITLKVRDRLEANGVRVKLTRDYNTPISIEERVGLANKEDVDYYISLHINSTENPNTGSGVEAYSNNAWSLSNSICKDLAEEFNLNHRGIYATPYYNRNIESPSTLIELGFINNDFDRDILVNYQDKIAEIVSNNILNEYNNIKTKTIKVPQEIEMPDGKTITIIKTMEVSE